MVSSQLHYSKWNAFMPFLLAEILNFQGSTHLSGVGSLSNNEYEYVGRQKRNFVCGVDNIYPEQIEELLLEISNIREVVVTKIPDDKYQYLPKYHISVFSMEFDRKDLESNIYELISSTLGESAIPGYIEYTNEPLPRTDNGKLNAALLEQQDMKNFN